MRPARELLCISSACGRVNVMAGKRTIQQPPEHHLRILHSELLKRGIESDIIASGYKPRLRLNLSSDCLNLSPDISFEGTVVVAKGTNSRWSFWWPWIEEICPADAPKKAAEITSAPLMGDESDTDEGPLVPQVTGDGAFSPGNDGKGFTQSPLKTATGRHE
jgi:hypothetical protein